MHVLGLCMYGLHRNLNGFIRRQPTTATTTAATTATTTATATATATTTITTTTAPILWQVPQVRTHFQEEP